MVAIAIFVVLPPGPSHIVQELPVIGKFARWDSHSYVQIALSGYATSLYPFRPLYPAILRGVSTILPLGNPLSAMVAGGFAWNVLMLVPLGVYLYKLTNLFYGANVARRSVLFLAIYPSSIFLSAIYPETTFLLLIVLTFYLLESGRPILACLAGFLAGLARPEGFLLAIPFVAKSWSDPRNRTRLVLSSVVVLMSGVAFVLFTYLSTGSLLISLQEEATASQIRLPTLLTGGQGFKIGLIGYLNIGVMGIACLFLFYPLLRRRTLNAKILPYLVWSLSTIIVYVGFSDVISWSRFTLSEIPLYWSLAFFTNQRRWPFAFIVFLYFALMVASASLFLNGYGIY